MKKILITGSTDGIGKLTAIKLAKEGFEVFLHGRNAKKLDAVVNKTKNESLNDKVEGFVADFSDLNAARKMGIYVREKLSSLDVLINNAGIFKSDKSITEQGYDIRFAVNYLAPMILTNELLPLLKKSEAPRIINLSSAAQSPVNLDALHGQVELSAQEAYAQSKLALTMWSMNLAEREKSITSISVNPGSLLNTKMVLEAYGQHWSSANKGRDILFELAISDEYRSESGKYFDNDQGDPKGTFSSAHAEAYNKDSILSLLKSTNRIIGNN